MSPFHGGYIRGAAVGYVLPPLAAKLRCARTAGTFFIMACHRGGSVYGAAAPSPPSEGFGFRAPPVADTARKASRCRPQVRERTAEAVDFCARRGSALASLLRGSRGGAARRNRSPLPLCVIPHSDFRTPHFSKLPLDISPKSYYNNRVRFLTEE